VHRAKTIPPITHWESCTKPNPTIGVYYASHSIVMSTNIGPSKAASSRSSLRAGVSGLDILSS
jgi:hypothetical protein